jgi:hypothetical protein
LLLLVARGDLSGVTAFTAAEPQLVNFRDYDRRTVCASAFIRYL